MKERVALFAFLYRLAQLKRRLVVLLVRRGDHQPVLRGFG